MESSTTTTTTTNIATAATTTTTTRRRRTTTRTTRRTNSTTAAATTSRIVFVVSTMLLWLLAFTIVGFVLPCAEATITVLDIPGRSESEKFASRPEYYYGQRFTSGQNVWARLQYVEDNLNLCWPSGFNPPKYNITVPGDNLKVALLVKNKGCPLVEKIRFAIENIDPPNIVKYLIVDGDRSLRSPITISAASTTTTTTTLPPSPSKSSTTTAKGAISTIAQSNSFATSIASSIQNENHRELDSNNHYPNQYDDDFRFVNTEDVIINNDRYNPNKNFNVESEQFDDDFRFYNTEDTIVKDDDDDRMMIHLDANEDVYFGDGEEGDKTVYDNLASNLWGGEHTKQDGKKSQPYVSADIGILHVSYATGYDLLEIVEEYKRHQEPSWSYSSNMDTKHEWGPRVMMNSKRSDGFGNRPVIVWMTIFAVLGACACTFLIVINSNMLWASEEEANRENQNQPQRPRRRRLTREQVRTLLPIYVYDGSSLRLQPRKRNTADADATTEDGRVTDSLMPSPSSIVHRSSNDDDNGTCHHAEIIPPPSLTLQPTSELYCCSICLDEYEPGEKLRCLPCTGRHTFHSSCIGKWLAERSAKCPLCNTELFLPPSDDSDSDSDFTEPDPVPVPPPPTGDANNNNNNNNNSIRAWRNFFNPFVTSSSSSSAETPPASPSPSGPTIPLLSEPEATQLPSSPAQQQPQQQHQQPQQGQLLPDRFSFDTSDTVHQRVQRPFWRRWFSPRRPTGPPVVGLTTLNSLSDPLLDLTHNDSEETAAENNDTENSNNHNNHNHNNNNNNNNNNSINNNRSHSTDPNAAYYPLREDETTPSSI